VTEDEDDRFERMADALRRIAQWAQAYPLVAFPEPDDGYWLRARRTLERGGLSLDRIEASHKRNVATQAAEIASAALEDTP